MRIPVFLFLSSFPTSLDHKFSDIFVSFSWYFFTFLSISPCSFQSISYSLIYLLFSPYLSRSVKFLSLLLSYSICAFLIVFLTTREQFLGGVGRIRALEKASLFYIPKVQYIRSEVSVRVLSLPDDTDKHDIWNFTSNKCQYTKVWSLLIVFNSLFPTFF